MYKRQVFAYYLASPLNWLVVLFPKSHIIEFIELLIIFKISLSGATSVSYTHLDVYKRQAYMLSK